MLIILIEIVRSSKKDLPSVELPKIILKLLKLLDSMSPTVRGRVYIALALIAASSKEKSIIVADICSAKVVATVERELRRNVVSNLKNSGVASRPSSRMEMDEKNF